jgi:hypothetical protein
MQSKFVTFDALTQSDLWQKFEASAQKKRRRPIDLLAEVIADFLETQDDVALFDSIERDLRHTGYTEDDSVELVKSYRASRRK